MNNAKFVFFGSSRFSCLVLDELIAAGFKPALIVATPDKPSGRKLALTPPPTKVWADAHSIPCFQPDKLKNEDVREKLSALHADIFIVASYGKIIPQEILNIPARSTLNVHPSLLPKLRGATPLQSAILSEDETGVTIIELDEQVDHGPILGAEKYVSENWPPYVDTLEADLAKIGGQLLAKLIPDWISGTLKATEQDHNKATFTKKISKEDGLIDLSGDPVQNLKKIRAYAGWPTAYFFAEHNGKKIRVVIKEAEIENGSLKISRVIPEGKKEMSYEDFLRGLK